MGDLVMGMFSPLHVILLIVAITLLFGSGRIVSVMGDLASGVKAFKKNMKEEDESVAPKAITSIRAIEHPGISVPAAREKVQ
jgi:TatA/E family protein of Tat protein translocase